MATSTGNFVCDNSTLANFKSWSQAISNAFSAFGWTQTTDTGQVNWTSIAAVPSSAFVYEVWKAADALAATMPIFVKVGYGFSATSVRFQVTVGTGSDGAGNITGQILTGSPLNLESNASNQGAPTFPCYFSGSAGEIRMYMWSVASGSPAISFVFVIERSKDSSGNNTVDYVTVAGSGNVGGVSSSFQQSFNTTTLGLQDKALIGVPGTSGANTGASFGTVAAFPCFPVVGKVGNPMLGMMLAYGNDAANGASVTVTSMYGGTHTFMGVNSNNGSAAGVGTFGFFFGSRGSTNGMTGLMRYE